MRSGGVVVVAIMFYAVYVVIGLQPRTIEGKVTHVIDGDTIQIGRDKRVRLGDFDAPEADTLDGMRATAKLSALVLGEHVTCRVCEGARHPGQCRSFGRYIAVCRLDSGSSGNPSLGYMMRAAGIPEGGR